MYPRFAKARIGEALSDTRVVLVAGPRQSGKTTLAMDIATGKTPFLTLDDATVLQSAIKNVVDKDKSPGRFLLTGSANLMTIPKVADSLAGRMEIIRLLPLSQAELAVKKTQFIDRAFAGGKPVFDQAIIGDALVDCVLSGGYPEALGRKRWARKQDWYNGYLDALVQRDVRDVAQIEQLAIRPQAVSNHSQTDTERVNPHFSNLLHSPDNCAQR